MSDEHAFLQAILANPEDDAPRLVYADWLDEGGGPETASRARFLRTDTRLKRLPDRHPRKPILVEDLKKLARDLDPAWLAVVSRLPVENCALFQNRCPKKWEGLQATEDPAVRFCTDCRRPVYYCSTIQQARQAARAGTCIAVDVAIPRTDGDLDEPFVVLGMPSRDTVARMRAAWEIDEVSAQRTAAVAKGV